MLFMAVLQLPRTVNLPNFDPQTKEEHQRTCQTVLSVEGMCLPAIQSIVWEGSVA